VSTPMVTALGDMATLPTLFLATFLVRNHAVNVVVSSLCVAACGAALVRLAITDIPAVRHIALEMTAVIVLTPLLDIAAGSLLQAKEASLAMLPGLYILIPPFVSQAGALGGILASRLSSKLQLGVITARGRPEAPALIDASLVVGFGLVIFAVIGVAAVGLSDLFDRARPDAGVMIGGTMLAGVVLLPIVLAVGYYVAVVTSRFGLDPDNHSVPIITSVMDLAGVAALLLAMSLLGVAVHG
jgi:mgtE-like transporter